MAIFNSYVCLPESSTIFGHLAEKARKNRIQVVNDTCGDGPEYARILPTMRYAWDILLYDSPIW